MKKAWFEMPLTEALGLVAITIMVVSYALESRAPIFVAIFSAGCALAAIYAFLIQSYPFLVAEALWSLIAIRRWLNARAPSPHNTNMNN